MAWIELHQGLREHKKTFACADILEISRVTMIGTLASLWLWALDNAQDGSLEGISNRTIAKVCDWPEKKADKLVSALMETGWLDNDGEKLIIHDWSEYAGRLMERREKDRERKKKDKVTRRKSAGIPPEQHENSCATVPIPYHTVPNLSESGTKPEGEDALTAAGACADGKPFTLFWEAYPKKSSKQREEAWAAWKLLNPNPNGIAHIMTQLEAWKKSEQWTEQGGRFVPQAVSFLDPEGEYLRKLPVPGKRAIPKGASGELGEAELEAIQRVLREG